MLMSPTKNFVTKGGRRMGWRRDLPDHNDLRHLYGLVHPNNIILPVKFSNRVKVPYRFDQGDTNSCTANSACYVAGAQLNVLTLEDAYSRLFYYYDERELEDAVAQDDGASIRDGISLLTTRGICKEKTWPFDVNRLFTKPSEEAYKEAIGCTTKSRSKLVNRNDFRQCLAKGYLFTIGITCYDSIDSDELAKTGIMRMPGSAEKPQGGHAVTPIGYDNDFHNNPVFLRSGLDPNLVETDMYEVLNSWSENWGDGGVFWVPAKFIEDPNYSTDAWTFRF